MSHRVRHAILVAWCFLGLLGLSAAAHAATPATLLGPDLRPRVVYIQGLGDGVLSYFDTDRVYKTMPLDQLVQVRDVGGQAQPPAGTLLPPGQAVSATRAADSGARVVLTDGQRLSGKVGGATPDGQKILWQNSALGTLTISLDSIKVLALHPRADSAGPDNPAGDAAAPGGVSGASGASGASGGGGGGDRVELVNGDVLTGFVTAIKADGLELHTGDEAQSVNLPLDRVGVVRFNNPAVPPHPGQHMVWLGDGSRVLVLSLGINDQDLRLRPALAPEGVVVPLSSLRRIDLATAAGTLRPLGTLSYSVTGGQVFGVPMPPRLEGRALRLHAPVTLNFDLPDGVARLAARARLDTDQDADAVQRWADMDLVIRIDDKEVARVHIDAAHPTAEVNLPVTGRRLAIELGEGANGPVMDRLLLEDAVVLVQPHGSGR